ncbi:hypothetical protein L2E82_44028 [Cichorium intybus]|uniref:Uncharacterized protein n=1 Tax=Cichorium intybus TaxID=13427 RepID=A0ACB8ZPH3_CICIN|nr:hypothetical protein L2E82_44028 [Cichorium intybus]
MAGMETHMVLTYTWNEDDASPSADYVCDRSTKNSLRLKKLQPRTHLVECPPKERHQNWCIHTQQVNHRRENEQELKLSWSIDVLLKMDLLEKIAPTWMNVSLRMKDDPVTDRTFGRVLEMYAYAVASALHGVQHILRKDFMSQRTLVKMVNEATANIPGWDTS